MNPVVSPQAKPRSFRTTIVASQKSTVDACMMVSMRLDCFRYKLNNASSWGSTTG